MCFALVVLLHGDLTSNHSWVIYVKVGVWCHDMYLGKNRSSYYNLSHYTKGKVPLVKSRHDRKSSNRSQIKDTKFYILHVLLFENWRRFFKYVYVLVLCIQKLLIHFLYQMQCRIFYVEFKIGSRSYINLEDIFSDFDPPPSLTLL